jgi:hypothetical protein
MAKQQVAGANHPTAQSAVPVYDKDAREEVYQWIKKRAMQDPELLTLLVSKPELRIKVERPVLEVNGNSLRGALGLMITKGFF